MPDIKVKARVRRLEKKIGSVGTDPFIPARRPGQMLSPRNMSTSSPPTPRRIRWRWAVLIIGVVVLVGLFAALRH